MKAPTTYAEWSACLDLFESRKDDDAAIAAMQLGTLSWTGGVAPLFARRVSATLDTRLKLIGDEMSRGLRLGGDTTTLSRAMLDARQKLAQVHRLAALPVFAEALRASLEKQIAQYAETAQQSLEDSASADRSGLLASTIRQCSLLLYRSVTSTAPLSSATTTATTATPAIGVSSAPGTHTDGRVRRRNILV